MVLKQNRKKANHQDTKYTKRHQEKPKNALALLGETLCSWCLGGSQFGFTGANA
jgi:hypothetical protein